jgi:hypothetical protein
VYVLHLMIKGKFKLHPKKKGKFKLDTFTTLIFNSHISGDNSYKSNITIIYNYFLPRIHQ